MSIEVDGAWTDWGEYQLERHEMLRLGMGHVPTLTSSSGSGGVMVTVASSRSDAAHAGVAAAALGACVVRSLRAAHRSAAPFEPMGLDLAAFDTHVQDLLLMDAADPQAVATVQRLSDEECYEKAASAGQAPSAKS